MPPAPTASRTELRVDRWRFDLDDVETEGLAAPRRTAEGFLYAEARAARPGIYTYLNADGSTRRELVPPEVLFHADDLASLGGKPVTVEHPEKLLTPSTVGDKQVGTVGNIIRGEGGYVIVQLGVHKQDGLDAIDGGKVEVSPAYKVDLDETPGEHPEYGRYDAIQIRRYDYNHLAICDAARGGHAIRLRVDSLPAAIQVRDDSAAPAPGAGAPQPAGRPGPTPSPSPSSHRRDGTMYGPIEYALRDAGFSEIEIQVFTSDPAKGLEKLSAKYAELAAELKELQQDMADLPSKEDMEEAEAAKAAAEEAAEAEKVKADALQGQVDVLTAEATQLRADADAAKGAVSEDDALPALVAWSGARTDALTLAETHQVNLDGVTLDEMTNAALVTHIETAAVKAIVPTASEENLRRDSYRRAVLDVAAARADANPPAPANDPGTRRDGGWDGLKKPPTRQPAPEPGTRTDGTQTPEPQRKRRTHMDALNDNFRQAKAPAETAAA